VIDAELVRRVLAEELAKIRENLGESFDPERFRQARDLVVEVALADDYVDFLTLPAYQAVLAQEQS
jgi:malate synthase